MSKLSAYLQDSETSVNDRHEQVLPTKTIYKSFMKKLELNVLFQGLTMLHYASDRGNMKVVELLVNRGADVNALVSVVVH